VALPYYPYEKKVYFRGYNNTIANINQVMRIMPPEVTDIFVVYGCSAGGVATYTWLDSIADIIK
jgi:hypothetical protein